MSSVAQAPHRASPCPAMYVVAAVALELFAAAASAARLAVGPGGGNCTYSTIQAAIDAAASGDTINIADTGSAYNEKLTITDKSLTISSCPCYNPVCLYDTTHNTLTNATISGSGGANAPVIKIVTTNANNPITVNFDRLTIQDGHSGSIDGGGISFSGVGTLNLTRAKVFSNAADYGAGINFKANGGQATLNVHHDTFVTSNTAAVSGGGLRLENNAQLTMDENNTWVAFNQATTGLGGGLELISDARADIASPGYGASAVIYENTANNGGGVALSGNAFARFYTSDALHPIALDNNTAYSMGGGLYVDNSSVCLQDARVTNNIAQDGTGIVIGSGSFVAFNRDPEFTDFWLYCDLQPVSVPCDAAAPCNIVHDNVAMNVKNGNSPTQGATVLVQGQGNFVAASLDLRGNTGGRLLHNNGASSGFATDSQLFGSLIAQNTFSQEVVLASPGYVHTSIDNCTITNNSIGAARVIGANDTLSLNDNIIDSSLPALAFSGDSAQLTNQYNIAGNTTGMLATPYNIQTSPTFVDAAHGDYRLFYGIRNGTLVKSAGIDFAPPLTGDDRDVRGAPRDQAIVQPLYGDRDLGAYEMQGVGDRIFIATFGDDTLLVQ